jgi:AraC-like DNA-binding protein
MYGKSENREDYQRTSNPIVAMEREFPDQTYVTSHTHGRGQLAICRSGILTIITDDGTRIVPPNVAIWIPAGTRHAAKTVGVVKAQNIYLDHDENGGLPPNCVLFDVHPLLQELVSEAVRIDNDYGTNSRESRLMSLILDEIRSSSVCCSFPLPKDPRATRVCNIILGTPRNNETLASLAKEAGASPRTLERLFLSECGMSFSQWRREVRLNIAIRLLREGESISNIAVDLGYDSTSAFSLMFRKALGVSPSEYLTSRPYLSGRRTATPA